MGVSFEHIVLYGYQFPYDAYDVEECEPYQYSDRSEGDVVVVADGRSTEYMFVGVLQAKSDDGRWDQATLPVMELQEPASTQCLALGRVIEELGLDPDSKPSHYVFTHFS